ncbi:MAG TPA: amino acid permease [Tepidisphaeraceae bacterium]|jgi:amino acid transporter|nr:amino acid permease [Tepidisphaeraceae bacterium]
METSSDNGREKPLALALLSSTRPRTLSWKQAAGLLFGDWGTSRLYVLGLAFLFAGRSSFWLILSMSLLILAVGWAYSQICRIYPDGGGVYSAAKRRSRTLAVVGALLLFADYTITASLSALEAFHYFGLPLQKHAMVQQAVAATTNPGIAAPDMPAGSPATVVDAGDAIVLNHKAAAAEHEQLFAWDSPGLWAIVAIGALGLFNLLGPKHSSAFAIAAALGMILITMLIVFGSIPHVDWGQLEIGHLNHDFGSTWVAFVSIVLALSGVEAIANLTGVMKKPVGATASKAVWIVAIEVALFNVLLALVMLSIFPLDREAHKNDMLAYIAKVRVGEWAEWCVRIVGGVLLLSATNTAINGLMSVVYVVSRDGELPAFFQKTNRYGTPWIAAALAMGTPAFVLLLVHDLESLVALYAIGVVGAVAIDVSLCAIHPRLRSPWRKVPMATLGVLLVAIWITLAFTKLHALAFVGIVMAIGLTARYATKQLQKRRGPKLSLLRQAIAEQVTSEAMGKPKILLGTYGSDLLASVALREAQSRNATLVVCFVRQVALSYGYDDGTKLTIDTDLAALRTFSRFLEMGHDAGVTVLPVYESGQDAAELIAETAALYGCEEVLIGTSRQGALYHLIKGTFQRRLEALLPGEVKVKVVVPDEPPTGSPPMAQPAHVPA